MKKAILLFAFAALSLQNINATKRIYTKTDSIRAEKIMKQASSQPAGTNTIVYIGRQLLSVPYVAQTLEKGKTEHLVINTMQLDCTTFVENVLAMYLCVQNKTTRFADFCSNIQKIRYAGGKVSYPSRLHYFSTWIEDNTKKGIVQEQQAPNPPFTAKQTIMANFMSTHADRYPMLKGKQQWIKQIADMEKSITGTRQKYIPTKAVTNSNVVRKTVHNGDIIAIVTTKAGLEISHIGIAVWHKDGLHMLNASSLYHKVVEDNNLLQTYLLSLIHI